MDPLRREDRPQLSADTTMFIGVATIVLGGLALLAPLLTGIAVSVLVGVLLIGAGIMRAVFVRDAPTWPSRALALLLGLLSVLAGTLLVLDPVMGLMSLALLLAVYFLIDGVAELVEAVRLSPQPRWWTRLVSGGASVVLSALIWWGWPLTGAWAVGALVGIRLLFSGWATTLVGAALRRARADERVPRAGPPSASMPAT